MTNTTSTATREALLVHDLLCNVEAVLKRRLECMPDDVARRVAFALGNGTPMQMRIHMVARTLPHISLVLMQEGKEMDLCIPETWSD